MPAGATPTSRTFPVTVSVIDGFSCACLQAVRDVRPARGYGLHGDAEGIATALAEALAKIGKLSRAQVLGIEHALEYAIRHVGYYHTAPTECVVDFDKIELALIGETHPVVLLSFSGLAPIRVREHANRFLFAYSHNLGIGRKGGFRAKNAAGVRVRGPSAVYMLDYYGRGSSLTPAVAGVQPS